jgi:PAS domain-containing protein
VGDGDEFRVALSRRRNGQSNETSHVVFAVNGRALRASEARLRNLLATLDLDAFMARDLDDPIRFWPAGCERLFGWTAAEVVGRVAHELLGTVLPVPLAEIEATY